MPLYDLKCSECNHEEEIFNKTILTENDVIECPKCFKKSFKKVWTSSGYNTSFGLRNWRSGMSLEQQANALLNKGTTDGKREL